MWKSDIDRFPDLNLNSWTVKRLICNGLRMIDQYSIMDLCGVKWRLLWYNPVRITASAAHTLRSDSSFQPISEKRHFCSLCYCIFLMPVPTLVAIYFVICELLGGTSIDQAALSNEPSDLRWKFINCNHRFVNHKIKLFQIMLVTHITFTHVTHSTHTHTHDTHTHDTHTQYSLIGLVAVRCDLLSCSQISTSMKL